MASQAVPFYLQTVEQKPLGTIDFTDTFSYVKQGPEKSFWQDIADGTSNGVQTVFDAASGTWKSVKAEIVDTTTQVGSGISTLLDKIKENILFVVIVGLVVIYFVAKSGILHQIAEVMP